MSLFQEDSEPHHCDHGRVLELFQQERKRKDKSASKSDLVSESRCIKMWKSELKILHMEQMLRFYLKGIWFTCRHFASRFSTNNQNMSSQTCVLRKVGVRFLPPGINLISANKGSTSKTTSCSGCKPPQSVWEILRLMSIREVAPECFHHSSVLWTCTFQVGDSEKSLSEPKERTRGECVRQESNHPIIKSR